MPDIVLRNIGKGRDGITAGELADIVTQAVLREAARQAFRKELDEHIDEEVRELKQKFGELFD